MQEPYIISIYYSFGAGNTSQTPRPAGAARPDEHFYHDHRIIKQEKIELQSQVQIRHPLPSEMDFAVHSTDCTIDSSQKSVSCKRLHSSTAPKDASEICGIQQRILANKKRSVYYSSFQYRTLNRSLAPFKHISSERLYIRYPPLDEVVVFLIYFTDVESRNIRAP